MLVFSPEIRRWTILIVMAVAAAGAAAAQAADPAAAKAAALALLQKGWEKTAAGRQLAEATDVNSPELKGDPYVLAAHWLALMNQGSFEKARHSLDEFLKLYATTAMGLPSRRAEVWIYTVKQDFRAALVAADKLGQAATPSPPATDSAALAAQQDAIAFLGRFTGFLEGPADNASEDLRKKFEQRLLARLSDSQKQQFEEAKAGVLAKYEALMKEAAGAGEEAKKAAEADKQEALEKLGQQQEKLAKDAEKVEDKDKQLTEERRQKLAELDRQDAPLAQQLSQLSPQANNLNLQLNQQQPEVQRLQQLARTEQNPQLRQQRQLDAQRAQDAFNNGKQQLTNLWNQIQGIERDRERIERERRAIRGDAAKLEQKLNKQRQGIEQGQKKNESLQKRTEKSKAGATGRVRALETKAEAFRTYDDYPFEELRAALLARLQ